MSTRRAPGAERAPARPRTRVGAFESCPGRFVFIEEGNTDAWIATDCCVDPET